MVLKLTTTHQVQKFFDDLQQLRLQAFNLYADLVNAPGLNQSNAHGSARGFLRNEITEKFIDTIGAKYSDAKTFAAYHVLIGSTPDFATTIYTDFPGADSVHAFYTSIINDPSILTRPSNASNLNPTGPKTP